MRTRIRAARNVGVGAHQAISAFRSAGDIAPAVAAYGTWTLVGVGALLAPRMLGLRTPAEIAASPEPQGRVHARRPLVVAVIAVLAPALVLANVLN